MLLPSLLLHLHLKRLRRCRCFQLGQALTLLLQQQQWVCC
jgi:hypothetical protein